VRARALIVAALGIVALAALALGRVPAVRPAAPAGGLATPRPAATPPPRAVDPETIRDLFHFADSPPRAPAASAGERLRARDARAQAAAPPPAPGPRLVGLVSRGGRMLAALAAEGEVVLAGPGDTAAGVTVLAVDEEGVRIRRADGSEEMLELP
jgi:hypothetical protein